MSDTALNQIIQYGTAADRIAFTPDPAVGSQVLYVWYETDNAPDTYIWDGSAWVQINGGSGGITELTGDVAAGPGSGSQISTIASGAVTPTKLSTAAKTKTLGFSFSNGGSPLTVGQLSQSIRIPVGFTITSWSVMADQNGDIEFDIYNDAPGSTFPPTTSIVASAPPEITGGTNDFASSSTLTAWTTAITASNCLRAEIISTSGTIEEVMLQITGVQA